jgi:hypothetical protein
MSGDEPPWAQANPLAGLLARSLEEGDTTKFSRSDVLRALIYPTAATAGAFPFIAWARAPDWAMIGDGVAFGTLICLYVAVYVYCFFFRPDALRSERFELTKYAIEHQLVGDSVSGLRDSSIVVRALPDREGGDLVNRGTDASGG